jgi:hypothetical protein
MATGALTEDEVRRLLSSSIHPDGGLYNLGWYLSWVPGSNRAALDGEFTADELEAIACWMRKGNGYRGPTEGASGSASAE